MVPIEASTLPAIEEIEPAIKEALPTIDEVDTTTETPVGIKVIIPLEGGSPARGHIKAPSSSWALEPSDNTAEIEVTQVSEQGP